MQRFSITIQILVRVVRFELTLDRLSTCCLCRLGYTRMKWRAPTGFEPASSSAGNVLHLAMLIDWCMTKVSHLTSDTSINSVSRTGQRLCLDNHTLLILHHGFEPCRCSPSDHSRRDINPTRIPMLWSNNSGALGWIRTCTDMLLRRVPLPIGLRGR